MVSHASPGPRSPRVAPLIILGICVLALSGVRASGTDSYRDFTLGSSVAAVRAVTRAADRDLQVRFDRPTAVQRLEWRVPQTGSAADTPDPVREITFDFVGDQLYRITVTYDERRTAGLTHADVLASVEATYGPRTVVPGPERRGLLAIGDPTLLARWRGEGAVVSLQHVGYSGSYQLQLSSVSLELAARRAETNGRALEAREAPVRAAALLKRQDEDDRTAQDESRSKNKESFRP